MTEGSRNVAASVRARLLNLARERGDDFNLLRIRGQFAVFTQVNINIWPRMPYTSGLTLGQHASIIKRYLLPAGHAERPRRGYFLYGRSTA